MAGNTIAIKYGGSSLKTPEDFLSVASQQRKIYEAGELPICVNSARSGNSDLLKKIWNSDSSLKEYAGKEEGFYSELFTGRSDKDAYMNDFKAGMKLMAEALEKKSLGSPIEKNHRYSFFFSHAETEAGQALQYLLRDFQPDMKFLDGFEAGVVATKFLGSVDIERSIQNIRERSKNGTYCYGGFVGMDPDHGQFYYLLDRDSTDETAALVAAARGANEYWNIKDVDGVFICDPGVLDSAEEPTVIEKLSYNEALNITRNGAAIIHPTGLIISKDYGINIRVTSLVNGSKGTLITNESGTSEEHPYAAISSGKFTCLTVSDNTMDIPGEGRGYMASLASVLAFKGYDILSPTGPGTSMTMVVAKGKEKEKDRSVNPERLCAVVREGLAGMGRRPTVNARVVGYIALTGARMRDHPGVISDIGKTMGDAGISISGIDAGDVYYVDTPVISFIVHEEEYEAAVNALRKQLF